MTAPAAPAMTPGSGKPTTPEVPAGGNGKPDSPAGGAGKPTPPSAPYPITNGTQPFPVGPTGFMTSTKPSLSTQTPQVPAGSETASLPNFSFLSEVPSATSSAVEMPSSVATPAGSATPSAGGDYGYGSGASSVMGAETPKASSTPVYVKPTPTPSPTPAGEGSYGSGYGTY